MLRKVWHYCNSYHDLLPFLLLSYYNKSGIVRVVVLVYCVNVSKNLSHLYITLSIKLQLVV